MSSPFYVWEKPGFNMKTVSLTLRKKTTGEPIGQPKVNLVLIVRYITWWVMRPDFITVVISEEISLVETSLEQLTLVSKNNWILRYVGKRWPLKSDTVPDSRDERSKPWLSTLWHQLPAVHHPCQDIAIRSVVPRMSFLTKLFFQNHWQLQFHVANSAKNSTQRPKW